MIERVPFPAEKVDRKQKKEQKIVGDHAGPGRDEPIAQKLGTDKRTDDSDAPHADDVEYKRRYGFADALHHAFDDNGHAVDRLRNRDHPQNDGTQQNYLSASGKQAHHIRRKRKQQATGDSHHQKLQQNQHF